MSREYDIKDILLEAGTRDYAEMKNADWQPSKEHAEFMEKLYKKKAGVRIASVSGLVKGLSAVAAAAIIVCLALAIKPLREPLSAFFGSLFTKNADTPGVTEPFEDTKKPAVAPGTETEAETEKENVTEEETAVETTVAPPFTIPTTDDEWISYLISSMAKNGYTKEKWEKLLSYGDLTFEYLYNWYKKKGTGAPTAPEKAYISAYFADLVKDEISAVSGSVAALQSITFPDKSSVTAKDKDWFKDFLTKAVSYSQRKTFEFVKENTPVTKKLLDAEGVEEKDYYFNYNSKDIIACIRRLAMIPEGETLLTKFNVVYQSVLNRENVGLILDAYFNDTYDFNDNRDKALALIGFMYYCKAQNEMLSLIDARAVSDYHHIGTTNGYTLLDCYNIYTYKEKAAAIITEYLNAASAAAKETYLTNQIAVDDYPYTYALLQKAGYDGLRDQNETEKKAAELLKELENLYNAVKYGYNGYMKYDGLAEVYETDDDISKMSEELYAKVRKYYPEGMYKNPSYQAFHSQTEGFETLDDWYDYYSKILPEDVVRNFMSCENRYFFTADGKVYTTEYWSTQMMNIDERTARTVEEKNGVTVISFSCTVNYKKTEHTVNVTENDGVMRIVGGSFINELMSFPVYGDVKSFIREAVWSLSPSNSLIEYQNFYNVKNENELPAGFADKLKQYYGNTNNCFHYFTYKDRNGSVINSLDHYKKGTVKFFSSDFVNEYFKDNRYFIEADGTLYASENGVSFLEVEKIHGVKKLSDTKYEIEMRIIETGVAPGIPTWECTALVEVINGSPVIVGGTFLSDVLLNSFK